MSPLAPTPGPPPGWPPRRRRRPVSLLIGCLGVLGAVVLAVGVSVLVVGRIVHLAPGEHASAAASTDTSAAPATTAGGPVPDAGELRRRLEHAHAGVHIDWDAPGPSGSDVDAGQPVAEAPGVLVVESVLGRQTGVGAGIVLTADGLAITNYHVVADSTEVFVTDPGTGERHTAAVLGRDAAHDIAVLDVDGVTGLRVASVGPATVTRGQRVAAVGSPGGQGRLLAVRGQVLGLDRSIMAASQGRDDYERLSGLVQTDADVVPGYSGGPLVDADGQVVAVTVAASEGATGDQVDGFAIPLDVALGVVAQVLSGVETDAVSIGPDGALGVVVASGEDGVEVLQVNAGGPAAGIGLAAGDVITGLDGKALDGSAARMSRIVNDRNVGDRLRVTWRTATGERREAEAVLEAAKVH